MFHAILKIFIALSWGINYSCKLQRLNIAIKPEHIPITRTSTGIRKIFVSSGHVYINIMYS